MTSYNNNSLKEQKSVRSFAFKKSLKVPKPFQVTRRSRV